MKCVSCGAEINLTDKVCPACGRILTETAAHQAEREHYQQRGEKAKSGMNKAVSQNVPIVINVVVMVILVIGICVANYVKENAYHFHSDAMRKESKENYEEYSVTIQEYLDAADYTGFTAFMNYHNIAEYEAPYEDLKLLYEMASKYGRLLGCVKCATMHGPDARWYRPEEDVADCSRAIRDFYYEYDWKKEEIEADSYCAYIQDMKDKADIVLEVYLGLDEAGRAEYMESSDLAQTAYLEGVILK